MRTVAAAALPLAWSTGVLPRLGLGLRGRTAANAAFATGYLLVFHGRPNWLSAKGLRVGAVAAGAVAAGVGAALAIPATRTRLRTLDRPQPEAPLAEWVAFHIPLGTVYPEETIFRGTLDPLLESELGARPAAVLSPILFGLWHIQPARAAGDSIPATVAFTTAAGAILSGLRRRTDSALAPSLLHLAANVGGALAPRLAGRTVTGRLPKSR
ncbi:CPBP family intramembrane metalloprotease [Nocardia panacis]|uniref:CPBP family intramembrane metalloprotease n=1 Tax=Nocardia panacis TaxID=2340916 RepID=A0A3A4KH25_9NOCA|nr:CPBP family intramembrane glutamic endopeptidase [Nocardia panacis]RJO78740.1 CPBP family intramembrane metalloprotease [Nocardia panacis]